MPLAHQPVPSLEVRGAVRFPVGVRLSRRSAERTPWEASVAQPVPDVPRPTAKHARQRRQQPVDPVWLQAPACQARPEPCRTHIALAIARVEAAIRHPVPWGVMVIEAWDVAADVVQGLARRRQDWIRRLNTHRGLATAGRGSGRVPPARSRIACRGSRPRPRAPSPSASTPPGVARGGAACPPGAFLG